VTVVRSEILQPHVFEIDAVDRSRPPNRVDMSTTYTAMMKWHLHREAAQVNQKRFMTLSKNTRVSLLRCIQMH
jgi:hypothetical protein